MVTHLFEDWKALSTRFREIILHRAMRKWVDQDQTWELQQSAILAHGASFGSESCGLGGSHMSLLQGKVSKPELITSDVKPIPRS